MSTILPPPLPGPTLVTLIPPVDASLPSPKWQAILEVSRPTLPAPSNDNGAVRVLVQKLVVGL